MLRLLAAVVASSSVIIDRTIAGPSGSCHLYLDKSSSVLHIELCGRGTRRLAATTLRVVGEGLRDCSDVRTVTCIVRMKDSKGATVLSLPPIAKFIVAHGNQLKPILIVESRGLALAAVRVIRRCAWLGLELSRPCASVLPAGSLYEIDSRLISDRPRASHSRLPDGRGV